MTEQYAEDNKTIWTLGHSNHPPAEFLQLIKKYQIQTVIDVRSKPYSGHVPHFNRKPLEQFLKTSGVAYLFLGHLVGGTPDEEEFYDEEGFVLYEVLAQSARFQRGMKEILDNLRETHAAILCGEADPTNCHRRLLIGRVLEGEGVSVFHIHADGRVQPESELAEEEEFRRTGGQLSLFDDQEKKAWKSAQSVSQKKPHGNFSKPSEKRESKT
ncbi:MAG: DUF488 domain-containing protein [Planctomycetota bacterium]|nr:MAG: DUF488 domain-containing protein [Planctomycetota bacterium]